MSVYSLLFGAAKVLLFPLTANRKERFRLFCRNRSFEIATKLVYLTLCPAVLYFLPSGVMITTFPSTTTLRALVATRSVSSRAVS